MTNIRSFVSVDAYVAERTPVFPSRESWRWFYRQHRHELLQAGALIAPTGRNLIDPLLADEVVRKVGLRRAQELGPL